MGRYKSHSLTAPYTGYSSEIVIYHNRIELKVPSKYEITINPMKVVRRKGISTE